MLQAGTAFLCAEMDLTVGAVLLPFLGGGCFGGMGQLWRLALYPSCVVRC